MGALGTGGVARSTGVGHVTPMNRDRILFPPKDEALRADVHTLGAIVGEVIREQAGAPVFDLVERARLTAIRRREGDPEAEAELCELLSSLSPADASTVVRAFGTYFRVVNLAE